jgi:hypothetical protein
MYLSFIDYKQKDPLFTWIWVLCQYHIMYGENPIWGFLWKQWLEAEVI